MYEVEGQARKSLWIETIRPKVRYQISKVRLVRACGSKRGVNMLPESHK